jgi:lipoyl-dependent peroxiredoxin
MKHLHPLRFLFDLSKEKFEACAADAKANCPISKLLNTNITLEAQLV